MTYLDVATDANSFEKHEQLRVQVMIKSKNMHAEESKLTLKETHHTTTFCEQFTLFSPEILHISGSASDKNFGLRFIVAVIGIICKNVVYFK